MATGSPEAGTALEVDANKARLYSSLNVVGNGRNNLRESSRSMKLSLRNNVSCFKHQAIGSYVKIWFLLTSKCYPSPRCWSDRSPPVRHPRSQAPGATVDLRRPRGCRRRWHRTSRGLSGRRSKTSDAGQTGVGFEPAGSGLSSCGFGHPTKARPVWTMKPKTYFQYSLKTIEVLDRFDGFREWRTANTYNRVGNSFPAEEDEHQARVRLHISTELCPRNVANQSWKLLSTLWVPNLQCSAKFGY